MAIESPSYESVADKITDELREAIQLGDLKPGERLVERDVAARLGVSHIPVREALGRLADERLVERSPRRGARVAELSVRSLEEISSLRVVLEQFVCIRVQQRWNDELEARLRAIVAAMVQAAEKGDAYAMFSLDRQFHELLWELSDHQLLMATTARLRGQVNRFLYMAGESLEPEQRKAHALTHADIVDALASGDPEQVRAVIADHIDVAASRIKVVAEAEGGR